MTMPRVKRTEKRRMRFTSMEAFWAKGDLRFGPWRLTEDGVSDWLWRPAGRSPLWGTDEEALEAYLDLAAGGYGFTPPLFTETAWAFWRFERSLSAEDAFARVREARSVRAL